MIIKTDIFENINIDLTKIGVPNPASALFIDIETTGLSAKTSSIYMIGLTSLIEDKWTFTGLFAESPDNEAEILCELNNIISDYDTLIHFNGNRFDIPFIGSRANKLSIDMDLNKLTNIDLYKRINIFKHLLGVGNCKQKTIESFLGIDRDDKYNGGELIEVYKDYTSNRDEGLFNLLYQHNHDDLLGMLLIFPIFAYEKLSDVKATFENLSENEYTDYHGNCCVELMLEYTLPFSLPAPVSINRDNVFLSLKKDHGYLRIPLIYSTMRHYFEDYKNYYYLPMEDMAIHKSVASSVDKEYRQKATKSNCYIKKAGTFIPAYINSDVVKFKNENSPIEYIELNDSLLDNKKMLEDYFHIFLNSAYKTK